MDTQRFTRLTGSRISTPSTPPSAISLLVWSTASSTTALYHLWSPFARCLSSHSPASGNILSSFMIPASTKLAGTPYFSISSAVCSLTKTSASPLTKQLSCSSSGFTVLSPNFSCLLQERSAKLRNAAVNKCLLFITSLVKNSQSTLWRALWEFQLC